MRELINYQATPRHRRVLCALLALPLACAAQAAEFRFDFEPGKVQQGYTQVTGTTAYDAKLGYGIYNGAPGEDPFASHKLFAFAVDLAEGDYDVTLHFGDPAEATSTTVKAESRRLMIEKVETVPGKPETRTFTVNVRTPKISTGGEVQLNGREKGPPMTPDWDNHLTFEFNGKRPGIASMEITPAKDAVTVYIAGDSTVTDQPAEPWSSWGQMLPRFFAQGVAVSDQAESGLALYSFERQKRLDKVLSTMKKGDYLFVQFGHNDQKDKTPGSGPFTSYKENLKRFVDAARRKGGIPVLVSPMERRRWNGNQPQPTLADYAEAVRQVGKEKNAPVIDLNAMSLKFYTALGPVNSTKAFVQYPANTFPGQDKALKDDTHHNVYGGYELARCVVEGIKANVPALAAHLCSDLGAFDPSKPDAAETFNIPASPFAAAEKPAGN
jgi:lysophospholipase L1-like esterase